MKLLVAEVDSSFAKFSETWHDELENTISTLSSEADVLRTSYRRIVSLQAWRAYLLEKELDERSLAFYTEAQNDALVSHVMARMGSWRSALKALRSCLENVCHCYYYKDHPVELELWHSGKHRMPFSQLLEYFTDHPSIQGSDPAATGLQEIREEYSTLSRAVHASAVSFRMTPDAGSTRLWKASKPDLGAWSTRERQVITAINLLSLSLFSQQLTGARNSALRKSISLAVPEHRHSKIKESLGVVLFKA